MRLVISGYYGYGNIGDEAILAALITELRRRHPEAELTVLSSAPEATSAQYEVEAVSRWSLPAIWRALRGADLLISGGGGLIQDTTSTMSPLYYLGILRLARLTGTPYMIFAQGLGPLRCTLTRWATARCFRRAAAITVRDEQSAHLLADLGVTSPPAAVTADPALLLEPCAPEHARELLATYALAADRPLIGVSLRSWPQAELVTPAAALIRHLRESLAAQVLLIPFQPEQDLALAWRLASEAGGQVAILDQPISPLELLGIITQLGLLVSMRLHGLIFAAARQVPALALGYDPKVAAFAARAGQPLIELPGLSTDSLAREASRLWETRAERASQRQEAAQRLRQAAAVNFDILANLLAGPSRSEQHVRAG